MTLTQNTKMTLGLIAAVGVPAIMLAANWGQARAMNAALRDQATSHAAQIKEQNEVLVGIREEIAKLSTITAGTADALLEVRAGLKDGNGTVSDMRVELGKVQADLRALEGRVNKLESK